MFYRGKDGTGLADVYSASWRMNPTYICFFNALLLKLSGLISPLISVFPSVLSPPFRMPFYGGRTKAPTDKLFSASLAGIFGHGATDASFRPPACLCSLFCPLSWDQYPHRLTDRRFLPMHAQVSAHLYMSQTCHLYGGYSFCIMLLHVFCCCRRFISF